MFSKLKNLIFPKSNPVDQQWNQDHCVRNPKMNPKKGQQTEQLTKLIVNQVHDLSASSANRLFHRNSTSKVESKVNSLELETLESKQTT